MSTPHAARSAVSDPCAARRTVESGLCSEPQVIGLPQTVMFAASPSRDALLGPIASDHQVLRARLMGGPGMTATATMVHRASRRSESRYPIRRQEKEVPAGASGPCMNDTPVGRTEDGDVGNFGRCRAAGLRAFGDIRADRLSSERARRRSSHLRCPSGIETLWATDAARVRGCNGRACRLCLPLWTDPRDEPPFINHLQMTHSHMPVLE